MRVEPSRTRTLLDWYGIHHRDLPWRSSTDPYPILVSEVMLQQTQAARVLPNYARFLERFPDVGSLAQAGVREVLEAWSGLGYNRRAVRLRDAARIIASEGWPSDVEGLRRLPGVGPYTAAAVACFGFGVQVAAPDTNAARVLSRWEGRLLTGRRLEEAARSQLPPRRATDWNQALMDLGATLCRARAPRCRICPVAAWCSTAEVLPLSNAPGRFKGSRREARGAAVRGLLEVGEASAAELQRQTGIAAHRLEEALRDLIEDGLVVTAGEGFALAR